MTRERNAYLAAGAAIWLLSVLIGLDAAGLIDLSVWQFLYAV